MNLHGAPFILLVDNGSRRRDRRLRTFWRHETPVHEDGVHDRGAPLVLHEWSEGENSVTWTCWR